MDIVFDSVLYNLKLITVSPPFISVSQFTIANLLGAKSVTYLYPCALGIFN